MQMGIPLQFGVLQMVIPLQYCIGRTGIRSVVYHFVLEQELLSSSDAMSDV